MRKQPEPTRSLSLQYQTVFNSSLVDMIFYGADGRLMDLNEKACETFMIADRERFLKRHVHFNDIPSYTKGIYSVEAYTEKSFLGKAELLLR